MRTTWLDVDGIRLFTIDGQHLYLSVGPDTTGVRRLEQKTMKALRLAIEEFEASTEPADEAHHRHQKPPKIFDPVGQDIDDIPR